MKFLNFGRELFEDGAQGARQLIAVGKERVPLRTKDPKIELAVEEGDFQAVGGCGIAMRLWNAMDQSFEPEPAKVISNIHVGISTARRVCSSPKPQRHTARPYLTSVS